MNSLTIVGNVISLWGHLSAKESPLLMTSEVHIRVMLMQRNRPNLHAWVLKHQNVGEDTIEQIAINWSIKLRSIGHR